MTMDGIWSAPTDAAEEEEEEERHVPALQVFPRYGGTLSLNAQDPRSAFGVFRTFAAASP
jgi:hypothetical protein